MRAIEIERTAYPELKVDITEREIIERYTLEPSEFSLVKSYRGDQLSLAVRMKLFQHLLNYSLPLEDVPQKIVDYVAYQLQISSYSLSDARDPRYGQIALINKYTGFSAFSAIEQNNLNTWLIDETEKQSHLIDLINDAIFYLKEKRVELPSFQRLVRLVASALHEADKRQSILLNKNIPAELKDKLDALLQNECRYQRTPFYELKEPPRNPNANAIIQEVFLLQRLRSIGASFDALKQINNDKTGIGRIRVILYAKEFSEFLANQTGINHVFTIEQDIVPLNRADMLK